MKNRFMLAPLTNCQSHDDGRLSDDEFRWLALRAQGGFGQTTTCATCVDPGGRGFPGQLGLWSDAHVAGMTRLAAAIKATGSLAVAQLHHAGLRAPPGLIGGTPVAPSEDQKTGARTLDDVEVRQLVDSFVSAAARAERAGFDGVEIHGAHGYLVGQFLSPEFNRRHDDWGGTIANRARFLFEVIAAIRARARPDFLLAVRLSPERFGLRTGEILEVAGQLMSGGRIDLLDLSLWDVFKQPEDQAFRGRGLLGWFTDLERGNVRLAAAGKLMGAADARRCLEAGVDVAIIGRGAILHHDFPERVRLDPGFHAIAIPVSEQYLRDEGLGPAFIRYMRNWEGFVEAAVEA
jgi:2,4-dienoyl-CoA reductase-like NADH-dependent reductase (Old Yellow Enzyme family)